jgi:hypothetical protein
MIDAEPIDLDGEALGDLVPPQASAEICIVGDDVAGLTAAFLLASNGTEVIVVAHERPRARGGVQLAAVLEGRLADTERARGTAAVRLAVHARERAIDLVETIVDDEQIDCGFCRVDGYVAADASEHDTARRIGLRVETMTASPSPFVAGPVLRFPDQASLDAARYHAGLALAVRGLGVPIVRTDTTAHVVGGWPPRVLMGEGRAVTAAHVAVTHPTSVEQPDPMHAVLTGTIRARLPPSVFWPGQDGPAFVRVAPTDDPAEQRWSATSRAHGDATALVAEWTRLQAWAQPRVGARPMQRALLDDVDPAPCDTADVRVRNDAPGVLVVEHARGTMRGTLAAMMLVLRLGGGDQG